MFKQLFLQSTISRKPINRVYKLMFEEVRVLI